MAFSPVKASRQIVEKYRRYLATIFRISDSNYFTQFKKELDNEVTLAKGPYLDVTDAFVKGRSIEDLIRAGTLASEFSRIGMPLNRPLYKHQEEAILKVRNGKNIVVSTGTGSGKTESFLIPIFEYLIRQYQGKKLNPGVRALLIYPMNALANDQIERLRELLVNFPEITYGSYTGQTKHKFSEALIEYKSLNNRMPLQNELISREQMKNTPPHILITNYAMLEYLMLRPDDNVFFDGDHAGEWKFIVLDEAHVYNGSTGIEVAMLLRRLKAKLQKDDLRYILTSATLGGDNDNAAVAMFAQNLCDSKFEPENVIRAIRRKPESTESLISLPFEFYNKVAEAINQNLPEERIADIVADLTHTAKQDNFEQYLYDIVLNDKTHHEIRKHLQTPKTVSELGALMNCTETEIENFVTVASKCIKNGDRLFDARYHMFLRAADSVFITLNPSKRIFLTRKKVHYQDEIDYKVFEIATCSHCHAIYLVGRIENGYLEQYSSASDDNLKEVFLLSKSFSDSDEDHTLEDENVNVEEYEICSRCGFLCRPGTPDEHRCVHGSSYAVTVFRVKFNPEKITHTLTKCLSCENTNSFGILRMFFTGQEAATSVIGTSLFEELPSYSIRVEINEEEDNTGFNFSSGQIVESKTNTAKQFIAFSDNRQAAAFYSSYLDQTYRNILYKRLIVKTLKDKSYAGRGKSLNDFIEDLVYQFEKHGVAVKNRDTARKEAWKAALHELVDNNGITSLYRMGLLGISVDDRNMRPNNNLHLTVSDVAAICNVFALGMMADAAISYNASLNTADKEYFTHNGVEYSYTLSDANPRAFRRSFIPTSLKKTNKRLDYFAKVLKKAGNDLPEERIRWLLEKGMWKFFEGGLLKVISGRYKLDSERIVISRPIHWYVCSKCRKITMHNAWGVCPTFKCDGELVETNVEELLADNHYCRIYQELDIRELRVVEHTAQLSKETAYEYQKRFKQKEIDVLSCSTTFEMGVDVGTLETVFMRNMPPSPSNYAQRAGRAGRSLYSSAYALTFCNKSSHDFYFFKTPEKMIKGRIDPPKFNVENERIAIRHLYASALAFFWKKYPDYFDKAHHMTEGTEGGISGFELLSQYLGSHPRDLQDFLNRFLPPSLSKKFDVVNFGWIPSLMSKEKDSEGVFTKALLEYEYEVGILREAIQRATESEYGKVDHLRQRLRVYRHEEILSFLSRKNVLPKYGFPVDTVEMTVVDNTNRTRLGLQLQRDLSMAISEYAPGSQVVANGNLITSRYIKKVPNMNWKQFDYIICKYCHTLNIEPHVDEDELSRLTGCRRCDEKYDVKTRKVFLIPQFGFEADGDRIRKPGLIKPIRTYRNEIAYVGYRNDIDMHKYQIGKANIEIGISQSDEMAVLNESNFFVCEFCGYTVLDEKEYKRTKREKHNTPSGYTCRNDGTNRLKKFALGYRFLTDVVQLKFINPDLVMDFEMALSVLHGILRGICSYLDVEQNDISGCLQYFYNITTHRPNFELILYDKTPGGAGHVRRLNNQAVLEGVLNESLRIQEQCDCGGKEKDTSCYSCLRNYYNQKYHDMLKRRYVIDFINEILVG